MGFKTSVKKLLWAALVIQKGPVDKKSSMKNLRLNFYQSIRNPAQETELISWSNTNSYIQVRNNTLRDSRQRKNLSLIRKKSFLSSGPYCIGKQYGHNLGTNSYDNFFHLFKNNEGYFLAREPELSPIIPLHPATWKCPRASSLLGVRCPKASWSSHHRWR